MRRSQIRWSVAVIAFAVLLAIPAAATPQQTQAESTAVGTGGAAATVDVLATRAAIEALRGGANAVDAAVVAAAVLGVVEPFSCGIGGGGFMVIRTRDGAVTTIDHRETAPAAMKPDSFFEGPVPLQFNAARYSGLSVGVPGTVRGWDEALRRYGSMSLAEALRPAISVAREGFLVDQIFFSQTQANVDFFDDITSTRVLYLDSDGTPRDIGTVFRNPDLARTYERIAHLGAKGFYRGAVADAMVAAVQTPPVAPDANHIWRAGLMTMPGRQALRRARACADAGRLPRIWTCTAWDHRRAAARPSASPSISSKASVSAWPTEPKRCISSSRPRASRSPTATHTSPTPTSSTFRSPVSCRTVSRQSGAG